MISMHHSWDAVSSFANGLWAILASMALVLPVLWKIVKRGMAIEAMLKKEFGNGGDSLKDHAKTAAASSKDALSAAAAADERTHRLELAVDRLEARTADTRATLERYEHESRERDEKLQHDVANLRTSQSYLAQTIKVVIDRGEVAHG